VLPTPARVAAVRLGESLLRWAGLLDDDGAPTQTLDEIHAFAEAVSLSSIPETCRSIVDEH
jgi:hypothetical protein